MISEAMIELYQAVSFELLWPHGHDKSKDITVGGTPAALLVLGTDSAYVWSPAWQRALDEHLWVQEWRASEIDCHECGARVGEAVYAAPSDRTVCGGCGRGYE